jgi:polysaccharide biosynthesis transport protein
MTFTQFFSILRARWKLSLLAFALTVVAAVLVSLMLPKKFTAAASVVVDVKPDPISGMMLGQMMSPAIMATQVDILQSDRVALRVIRNLKLTESPQVREQWQSATDGKGTIEDWLARSFQNQLDVRPSRESNVITVGFQAPDPNFAAALANAFVKAYVDTAIELRVDAAKQYGSFFDQQAKEARDRLESTSSKLSEFQRANGIVGSDERLDVETTRLNELSTQLVMLQSVASESSSRQAQAAGGKGDRLAESLSNPVISSLSIELSRAEANLQELNSRLGNNHPQVLQVRANIAELRARLDTEMKRVTGSVGVTANINSSRLGEVRAQLEAQRTRVLKLKEQRDSMAVLQRDVENAQRAYDAIVARLNQTNLESQAQQSNINVLSQATPPLSPSSPRVLLNIAVAVFIGTLLAVGLALVRELLDRRVRSTSDLVESLGLPVLGVLPKPLSKKRGGHTLMAQRVISGRLPAPKNKG